LTEQTGVELIYAILFCNCVCLPTWILVLIYFYGIFFSWENVFTDLESGIDYYMWSIGSQPGYTDIMSYLRVVAQECGSTDKNNPLHLLNGHYYFINVRVSN
jgi:hypothetical protein